jgi:hypothetical protein
VPHEQHESNVFLMDHAYTEVADSSGRGPRPPTPDECWKYGMFYCNPALVRRARPTGEAPMQVKHPIERFPSDLFRPYIQVHVILIRIAPDDKSMRTCPSGRYIRLV